MNTIREISQQASQKAAIPLKLIMSFIYPILPLGLLAAYVFLVMVFESFYKFSIRNMDDVGQLILFLLWILGGPAGIYAFVCVLYKKHTGVVFWMFIYGLLSFAPIAVYFIIVGFSHFKFLWMVHSLYLMFSLSFMIKECFKLYQEVF